MTKEEFIFRVKRITETFGEKFYTQERIKILWNHLKNKCPVTFNESIDAMISCEKNAPTINQILRYVWDQERKVKRERPKSSVQCDDCESTGIIRKMIKRSGTEYSYAFKCLCVNGQALSDYIPSIADFDE